MNARATAVLAVIASLGLVAAMLGVGFARIGHPFELEWMEGAFVDHVCRILGGEALYVEPTADFVPFLYGPLFFYLSAAVSAVLGEGFLPLRLVSVGANLATAILLGAWIVERTRSRIAGVVAVGAYAGGYFVADTWFDLARADSSFVALALAAWICLERGRRMRSAGSAALLLLLAYLAKQTALLLAPAFAIAIAVRSPRRAACFAAGFAVAWAATMLVLDAMHDGWFWFYTWSAPRQHEFVGSLAIGVLTTDLRPLWPAVGLGGFVLLRRWKVAGPGAAVADAAVLGGLTLTALSSRAHVGGAMNVLLPALLAGAAVLGLAWREGLRAGPVARRVVPWIVVLQLLLPWVDFGDQDDPHPPRLLSPSRFVPTAADRAAGERIVAMLRDADGDVLVPFHGHLPRLAGKRGGLHLMALIDLERSGRPALFERVHRDFLESARRRQAALVLLDPLAPEGHRPPDRRLGRLVYPGYVVAPIEYPDDSTFRPVVGLGARPSIAARRAD